MAARWTHNRPDSLHAFNVRFPDEEACADYLIARRWPQGFRCPKCPSEKGYRLASHLQKFECAKCGHQTSATAGTIMHRTHLPLRTWFLAAHLLATHSNGISALQLQAQAGIGSYQGAWYLLHRLRKAMVDPERAGLAGIVEVDETSIVFRTKDEPIAGGQGRSPIGKLVVAGAVELHEGKAAGRVRLQVIADYTRPTLHGFVERATVPGSIITTDGNKSYIGVPEREHMPRDLRWMPAHVYMPWVHRLFGNLKRWGLGTFHGFRKKHLQAYLDEFTYRWNRRKWVGSAFDRLLGLAGAHEPLGYRRLVTGG